jgi:hypothetical protein
VWRRPKTRSWVWCGKILQNAQEVVNLVYCVLSSRHHSTNLYELSNVIEQCTFRMIFTKRYILDSCSDELIVLHYKIENPTSNKCSWYIIIDHSEVHPHTCLPTTTNMDSKDPHKRNYIVIQKISMIMTEEAP